MYTRVRVCTCEIVYVCVCVIAWLCMCMGACMCVGECVGRGGGGGSYFVCACITSR